MHIHSLSLSFFREGRHRGRKPGTYSKDSMLGPPEGGSLVSIPALPGPALALAQQYLDQEDTVVTTAECSIHGAGEILPPL